MKRGKTRGMTRGVLCTALGVAAVSAAWATLRPRMLVWGTAGDEAVRALPGDELVPEPRYAATRAITIGARAETVFPWLVQLGQNRGGFYTYDWLENLFGLDVHSADRIHPEWQDLRQGIDYVSLDPQQTMKMTLAVLEPPHAMVIRTGAPGEAPQEPGDFFKGEIAGSWAFVVEPTDRASSRLIVRWRGAWRSTRAASLAAPLLLEPVHFLMEWGMLRGIKKRAEAAGREPRALI
jgi:hypothetical protein